MKRSVREWTVRHTNSPHALSWLSLFSFSEASFFPVPADVPLVAILLGRGLDRWKLYCLVTTVASVLGGLFGYAIGYFLFDTVGRWLIGMYGMEQAFSTVGDMFRENAFWAVFISGFTPIPYKVFTISAGFFNVSFFVFLIASVLSRALRFFSVGYIVKVFGKDVASFVFRYFNILTFLIAALVILLVLFMKTQQFLY